VVANAIQAIQATHAAQAAQHHLPRRHQPSSIPTAPGLAARRERMAAERAPAPTAFIPAQAAGMFARRQRAGVAGEASVLPARVMTALRESSIPQV
jgi:hypothetical protein